MSEREWTLYLYKKGAARNGSEDNEGKMQGEQEKKGSHCREGIRTEKKGG